MGCVVYEWLDEGGVGRPCHGNVVRCNGELLRGTSKSVRDHERALGGQKIMGHHGAGSHDIAVESAASAPGRSSLTSPAAASAPSRVPPR
jgi:hypothetical protein